MDALKGTGVRNIDMPLLPDRVYEAITQRHDVSGAPPIKTDDEDERATPVDGWEVLERAGEMAGRGEEFALATVVWRQAPSSGQLGVARHHHRRRAACTAGSAAPAPNRSSSARRSG